MSNFPNRDGVAWIDVSKIPSNEVENTVFERCQVFHTDVLGAKGGSVQITPSDVMYGPPEVIFTLENGEKFYYQLIMEISASGFAGMNGFYLVPTPAKPA